MTQKEIRSPAMEESDNTYENIIFKLQDFFTPYGRSTYGGICLLIKILTVGLIVDRTQSGLIGLIGFLWIFYPMIRDSLGLESKAYRTINGKKVRVLR